MAKDEVDSTKLVLKQIKEQPLLSDKEFNILLSLAQNGNIDARNKIVTSNLKLILKFINIPESHNGRVDILDLIQEGSLGIIRAIETYDPTKGAFSTYASHWIKNKLTTSSYTNNEEYLPRKFIYLVKKYKRIVSIYQTDYDRNPNEEELCRELKITKEKLVEIKEYTKRSYTSLNTTLADDTDTMYEEIVSDRKDDYENSINSMDDKLFYLLLKEELSDREYFIFYYIELVDKSITYEELGKYFYVTKQRIDEIHKKAYNKVKKLLSNKAKYNTLKINLYNKYGNSIYDMDIRPISINEKCLEIYVEEFSNYKTFNIHNKDTFNRFKEYILKTYQLKIFDFHKLDYDKINYEFIGTIFDNISYEDLVSMYKDDISELSDYDKELLEKYFGAFKTNINDVHDLNNVINILINNCKYREKYLPIHNLKAVYKKYQDLFSIDQKLYINNVLFGTMSYKNFLKKYNFDIVHHESIMQKLERLYYNISFEPMNDINRDKYLKIRKKYKDSNILSDDKTKLLDMYYGAFSKKYSIEELSSIYNYDYIKMKSLVDNTKDYISKVYANMNSVTFIDKDIYGEFLKNNYDDISKSYLEIFKYYVVDGLSYEEISNITKLSKVRISDIISTTLQILDEYRFGIRKDNNIKSNLMYDILDTTNYSKKEKDIIEYRYVDKMSIDNISSKVNMSNNKIANIISKFNTKYELYLVKNVELNNDDIQDEINKIPVLSVIGDKEKEILSYYYGICSKYNELGEKLTLTNLMEKYNMTKSCVLNIINKSIVNLKLSKINILKPDNLYIDRDELSSIILDTRLPISSKQKDIICYLMGINDYPFKTKKELAIFYNTNVNSITKLYNRAIINIYKYRNNELAPKFDYYLDILPNLIYFNYYEKKYIIDYYKNNLTNKEIAKKYNINLPNMERIMKNINLYLYDLVNTKGIPKINYDYALSVLYNNDLPYYGDIEIARKAFIMFYGLDGKSKTVKEIKKELKLDCSDSKVMIIIKSLLLSIYKYKDGYRKINEYTLDDVKEYFYNNKDKIVGDSKNKYIKYFEKVLKNINTHIPDDIIADLLKNENKFKSIRDMSKKEVVEFLNVYKDKLTSKQIHKISSLFGLSTKNYMSGKEKMQVYKIISKFDKKEEFNHILKKD